MLLDNRKMQVIEKVLNADEKTLSELETILREKTNRKAKPRLKDFIGAIPKKETSKMRRAIKEYCEVVNPDDWK